MDGSSPCYLPDQGLLDGTMALGKWLRQWQLQERTCNGFLMIWAIDVGFLNILAQGFHMVVVKRFAALIILNSNSLHLLRSSSLIDAW